MCATNAKKPLLVGITGGIGAGKSTIARIFELLGVAVYRADEAAKCCMEQQTKLRVSISTYFGTLAYKETGKLNTAYIASRIFSNPVARTYLNEQVHPVVQAHFRNWVKQQQINMPYVLYEAALLYEMGAYKHLDKTLLVLAPRKLRIQRVLLRDRQRNTTHVKRIMATQLPDKQKKQLTPPTDILHNNGRELLIPQVLKLHELLCLHAQHR